MKLIIHIGGAKCGSSAIQRYLKINANVLRRSGVIVLGNNFDLKPPISGCQVPFFENLISQNENVRNTVLNRLKMINEG